MKTLIQEFLQQKQFAIAGVSRNPKKFGYSVFKTLREKGYDLLPINPNASVIDDVRSYASVSDLPEGTSHLYIVTPKAQTAAIVNAAASKGIQNVWIQQMSETPEALEIAKNNNMRLIHGRCMFMFADPKGLHKFHRSILELFRRV